jgi:hypothetical protein
MYNHHIMYKRILRFGCYTLGQGIFVESVQDQSLPEGVAEGCDPVHCKSLISAIFTTC